MSAWQSSSGCTCNKMPFIPEQHRISSQYIQDQKLKEAFQWTETLLCLILTIIMIIFIIVLIQYPSGIDLPDLCWYALFIGLTFLYIFYMMDCRYIHIAWHPSKKYIIPISEVSEHIIRLKRAEPHVWWKALCYHFAESKSTRRNPRKVTRVNTHEARVSFDHRSFGYTDISNYLVFSQKSPLVKIEFSKGFAFARPRHAEEFETVRNEFFTAHELVDDHMEKKEHFDLADVEFDECVCAGRLPRFINSTTYWICSALLLSWPYRVYVNYNTSHAHYKITKLFGHVRMIPSYSEAMLIDPAPPAYIIECPSPFDVYETSQTMTIFRTCSPNYVPDNLVRYVESDSYVYPPTYEEALRYPLFELSIDNQDNSVHPPNTTTRISTAITFETSL